MLVDGGDVGRGEGYGVVVVRGDVVLAPVGGAGPHRLVIDDGVLVVHEPGVVAVVDDRDPPGRQRVVEGLGGGAGARLVVGDDADGDAAGLGGEQGIAQAGAAEVVEGGVDGDGGGVEAREEGLLQDGDGRGVGGGPVGGEVDGRVWGDGSDRGNGSEHDNKHNTRRRQLAAHG